MLLPLFDPIDDGTDLLRDWCQAAGLEYAGLETEGRGPALVSVRDPEGNELRLSFGQLYRLAHTGGQAASQVPSPNPAIEMVWPPRPQNMPGLPADIRHPQLLRYSKN